MTKLMQWLCFVVVYVGLWVSALTDALPVTLSDTWKEVIFTSPVYLLITFACYSLATIGYRVATFNDCVEASEELKQEVEEAKRDLQSKGLKFS